MRTSTQISYLRAKYQADIIILISNTLNNSAGGARGWASQIGTPKLHPNDQVPLPSRDNSFLLLDAGRINEDPPLLLAHEVGHILGCQHGIGTVGVSFTGRGHGFAAIYNDPPLVYAPWQDIMYYSDNQTQLEIFSSPILKMDGVLRAIRNSRDVNITIPALRNLATDAKIGTVDCGVVNQSDAAQVIDENVSDVANYRQTGLKIEISNLPTSLKKGECATITLKLSGCNANNYRYLFYQWTNTTRMGFEDRQISGTQTLTKTICMPDDGSKYITGSVFLETFADASQYYNLNNYSSTNEYFFIPCSDCYPQPINIALSATQKTGSSLSSYQSPALRQAPNIALNDKVLLYQNNPNPFSEKTDIHFVLSRKANINLTIYNALGQIIATLADTSMNAGEYAIPFEAQHLASGTYTYRLTVDGQVTARTMVILK